MYTVLIAKLRDQIRTCDKAWLGSTIANGVQMSTVQTRPDPSYCRHKLHDDRARYQNTQFYEAQDGSCETKQAAAQITEINKTVVLRLLDLLINTAPNAVSRYTLAFFRHIHFRQNRSARPVLLDKHLRYLGRRHTWPFMSTLSQPLAIPS